MKRLRTLLVLSALAPALSATPLIVENYEDLYPGDGEPNFAGLGSNHPAAVLEVAAETPGEELFFPGNTRYLRWASLTGINPDAAGTASQFWGGPSEFVPFASGSAQVVSAGFDFIVGELHSELLFGIGRPQTGRGDDQNYAVQLRVRGVLGLSNRPEIVGSGTNREFRADIQQDVPYRLELVANKSGGPVTYESPLGTMTVGHERYDIYLFNHRTGVLQLLLDDVEFRHLDAGTHDMEGIWWGTFRYDGTGRAVDIKLNGIAVYENDIVLTGHDSVPPGPATAIVNFDDSAPATDVRSPLWNLPGNVVDDTEGLFGASNQRYFHIDRRNLPDGGISNKFRFNGVVDLVSIGFDLTVNRDETINSFGDAHDEAFLAVTGGDTIANAALTTRINIRGTRSVGNDGNPSEAEPVLNVVVPEGGAFLTNGFDWETPYRIEMVFNQTGETVVYNTPWADDVSLADETLHVYVYNYATGMNVAEERNRADPFVMEAPFLNGRFNDQGVAGTMADVFWKHVTGRRIDLNLDNISIFEDVAVVTDPGVVPAEAPRITGVSFIPATPRDFQSQLRNRFSLTFESSTGTTYGMQRSADLQTFASLRTIIPADSFEAGTTTIEVPVGDDRRFYRVFPLTRD
ncbi:MAG: hypothetical protein JJU00_08125 [Opitutales bacterium]|nr:hypothetical protein [Opitutales bacterium]